MTGADAETSFGKVAAFVVATAPGADAAVRDLLWRPVLERPLVTWPLRALAQLSDLNSCDLMVPVAHAKAGDQLISEESVAPYSECLPMVGDAPWSYALSVLLHPVQCSPQKWGDWIIVLDATLPLVTTESLRAGLRAAERTGVAIASEPVKETLKRVDGISVAETLPRDSLRRLISPAIFRSWILEGFAERTYRPRNSISDDLVSIAQMADFPLTTFDAGYPAVRVTSEDDLAIVETLLRQRESEASPS